MKRGALTVALGSLSVSLAGCLSRIRNGGDRPVDLSLEDPPSEVSVRGSCSERPPVASVDFHDPREAPWSTATVVEYSQLHELSKDLFRFSVTRGSAVACRDPKHFRQLFDDLRTIGDYPYPEDGGERFSEIFIHVNGEYYGLDQLTVRDYVLE